MVWSIEYTDEFEAWWNSLDETEQDALRSSIGLLIERGPNLTRPHADSIKASRHSNMKELRTQHQGRPYRTFFAFDPRRTAILLIAGDKTGDRQFYERMVPQADSLFDDYLEEIKKEGLI